MEINHQENNGLAMFVKKSLQTKARLIQHEKSHGVNLQEKVFSLVKSASILLSTKDILQITKEGYTNPVRGCGCTWRAPAKTNQNQPSFACGTS